VKVPLDTTFSGFFLMPMAKLPPSSTSAVRIYIQNRQKSLFSEVEISEKSTIYDPCFRINRGEKR